MFKRYTITAIVGIAISAFAFADIDHPEGPNLKDNAEYQQLLAESDSLIAKADSIRGLIAETRANMRTYIDTLTTEPSRDFINRYNSRIVELEEQVFNITTKQGIVASRINAIELEVMEDIFQKSIFERMDNNMAKEEEIAPDTDNDNTATTEEDAPSTSNEGQTADDNTTTSDNTKVVDDNTVTTDVSEVVEITRSDNLIENEPFVSSLSANDLDELRAAQLKEVEIEELVQEYAKQYATLKELIAKYEAALNQQSADTIYENIVTLSSTLEALNTEISSGWNHIIDTKYYAYGYVIETERNKELLSILDDKLNTMLQQCTENDNLYASNGIMRYALGRPAIIDFEIIMASAFGLSEANGSLQQLRETLSTPNYQLSPLDVPERRLFIDYQNITFGRTNYYNEANPLPTVKVYERGTIYRILLGVFKSRQPMTLFKGVQPLFIEKDEQEMNNYYAGGFATLEEAEAAQALLFDKGFKAPEICVWSDGKMVNLTADNKISNGTTQSSAAGTRYMLRIANDDMSDDIREYIKQNNPNKVITLRNDGYIIGTFDNHDEVTRLYITLGDEFGIDMEIMEVEAK